MMFLCVGVGSLVAVVVVFAVIVLLAYIMERVGLSGPGCKGPGFYG